MALDIHPGTAEQAVETAPSANVPPETASRANTPDAASPPGSSGVWWKRGVFALGPLGVIAAAVTVVPGYLAEDESSGMLTHTITRGNLVVSVTEQGTLESSENKEITCKVRGSSTVIFVVDSGTVVEKGDVLVRLDTKVIEETVSLQKTNAHIAQATLERTKADVAKNKIAIDAYLNGRYRSQLQMLQRELEIATANLTTARKMLDQSKTLFKRGYVTKLEVEGNGFTVTQAELELKVKQTQIDVLNKYTKEMELETLRGNLTASKSKLQADEAGLETDVARRERALEELENCVIKAERSGLVIYPSAAAWKDAPDIAEGARVHKDQVLLLMPDLSKMQIKVGIHESMIDRVKQGLPAIVRLPDLTLEATVTQVATVTKPGGWWTGNVVKYDTVINLPAERGLKPGMSAEVEIILAKHENVLTIPVSAVVETEQGSFCWVKSDQGTQKRPLQLGDSNDVFIMVKSGLKEGDEVVLNPLAHIEEAQSDALGSPQNDREPDTNRVSDSTNPGQTPDQDVPYVD